MPLAFTLSQSVIELLQPRTKLLETNCKHTRIFLLSLMKAVLLLHKYLSSPLPSFNVVLKTTGLVWAIIMAKTTLYGGAGVGQFVQVLRCPIMALILENRRICLKSFIQGCFVIG